MCIKNVINTIDGKFIYPKPAVNLKLIYSIILTLSYHYPNNYCFP